MGGEIRRVDTASGYPGEDVGCNLGKCVREVTEHPDLIRGTGPAAGKHERQI
jgi:hypothetical protein